MKALILTCVFLSSLVITVRAQQDTIKKDNARFVTTTNGNTIAGSVISSDEKELVLQTDQVGRVAMIHWHSLYSLCGKVWR